MRDPDYYFEPREEMDPEEFQEWLEDRQTDADRLYDEMKDREMEEKPHDDGA